MSLISTRFKELKASRKFFRAVNPDQTLGSVMNVDFESGHVPKAQGPEARSLQKTFPRAPQQRVQPFRMQSMGSCANADPVPFAIGKGTEIKFRNPRRWCLDIQGTNFRSAGRCTGNARAVRDRHLKSVATS